MQNLWLFLEPIYNLSDMQRSLPSELRNFNKVDKFLKDQMSKISKVASVHRNCLQNGLERKLEDCIQKLITNRANLNNYLNLKREAFPRYIQFL